MPNIFDQESYNLSAMRHMQEMASRQQADMLLGLGGLGSQIGGSFDRQEGSLYGHGRQAPIGPIKKTPNGIREELQQEVDEWLSEIK